MHYLNYEEHRRHGTEAFPLEYYLVDEQHPRYNMPYHWHRETELLYVLRGELHLSLNGKESLLHAGELCYIAGGTLHGGEPSSCAYECIDFNPSTLLKQTGPVREYLHTIENRQTVILPIFTKDQPGILKCASRLFAAARAKEEGWELLVLAGLFDFYGTIIQRSYYQDTPGENSNFQGILPIKAALEYIEQNYQHAISLDDLARISGLSAKYFCRYFHRIIHRTPIDYLNYYRIERACYLLELQQHSITEVAYECGFNDSSYFIRCFKKYKNTTPHRYLTAGDVHTAKTGANP